MPKSFLCNRTSHLFFPCWFAKPLNSLSLTSYHMTTSLLIWVPCRLTIPGPSQASNGLEILCTQPGHGSFDGVCGHLGPSRAPGPHCSGGSGCHGQHLERALHSIFSGSFYHRFLGFILFVSHLSVKENKACSSQELA